MKDGIPREWMDGRGLGKRGGERREEGRDEGGGWSWKECPETGLPTTADDHLRPTLAPSPASRSQPHAGRRQSSITAAASPGENSVLFRISDDTCSRLASK